MKTTEKGGEERSGVEAHHESTHGKLDVNTK